jgi:hypothetical protein
MSDDQHSNPIPPLSSRIDSWEDHAVFRESFLSLLPELEAEAFRLLGRRLYFDRQESVSPEELSGAQASIFRRELASAAADLAVLAGFLSAIGNGLDVSPADRPLVRKAQESAAVAAQLSSRLLGALGPARYPSNPTPRESSS